MAVLVRCRARQRVRSSPPPCNAVAAAQKIGGDMHMLVAGQNAKAAAAEAAKVAGVAKVLLADDAAYGHGLAENWRRCW